MSAQSPPVATQPTAAPLMPAQPIAAASSSSSPPSVSLQQLRTEFTLIIKTLDVLQSIQGPNDPSLTIKLFDSLKHRINKLPPLSLSAYWSQKHGSDSLVFRPPPNPADQQSAGETHDLHDPLNIGINLHPLDGVHLL